MGRCRQKKLKNQSLLQKITSFYLNKHNTIFLRSIVTPLGAPPGSWGKAGYAFL